MLLCITDTAVEDTSLEIRNLLDAPLSDESELKNKMNFLLTF